MGYRMLGERDVKWQPRRGLEGPFFYPNGQVLYYDPKEGRYWDPKTDFYLSNEDMDHVNQMLYDQLTKE